MLKHSPSMRGVTTDQEQDPAQLLRNTRTLGQRVREFFSDPQSMAVVLFCMGVAAVMLPQIADVVLILGLGFFIYTYTRKHVLPFRLPQRAKVKDFNDLAPGSNKPNLSRGITFFGNDRETNEELWFGNEDMRTHVLIFGSTGSGKTEFLISLAYNSLVQGSGFIYVDGKGDNSLYSKVFAMARQMGREDDILTVNFMTGARDIVGPQLKRISNTMNPFAMGSSSMLAQLVVSMMDSSAATPDGDMWKGRAISFVEALMKVLVYARDADLVLLDANSIRNYFPLDRVETMVVDKLLIRDGREPASLESMPSVVLEPITSYLYNLPGYDKSKKGKQVSQVLEQHGFITMQLTRVFTSLADTYGHILRTKLAEVDVKDVVLNRRILVVLLPALEKSPDELSNLGKVIVASLRAMMASGLGEEVEGDYRDVIQRKPTNSPTPYVCILDEYGYYAVQGFAVVPAQARSLGFSTVFAGQDLPAFQKASKEEAASIGANTNIKICMKLEDPVETYEFFSKTAGEAYVTKVDNFQTRPQSMTNTYLDTKSASFEKRARIDLLDLKEQGLGEAHIFFKSQIIRARTFYANPKTTSQLRINQFLMVEPPTTEDLQTLQRQMSSFQALMDKEDYFVGAEVGSDEINVVANSLLEHDYLDPIERGVTALIAFHDSLAPREVEMEEEHLPEQELNIFTQMRFTDSMRASILTDDFDTFSAAILEAIETEENIDIIERSGGKSEQHARSIAEEIVKDIRVATHYPPELVDKPSSEDLVQKAMALNNKIRDARVAKDGEVD